MGYERPLLHSQSSQSTWFTYVVVPPLEILGGKAVSLPVKICNGGREAPVSPESSSHVSPRW